MERKGFLSLLASLPAATTLPLTPRPRLNPDLREENALVLSGGGARGAYQAGIIADFTNQRAIDASYKLGYRDAEAGWQHYTLPLIP